jgi:hypothetical protein
LSLSDEDKDALEKGGQFTHLISRVTPWLSRLDANVMLMPAATTASFLPSPPETAWRTLSAA